MCKAQRGLTRHFNTKHGAPAASNLSEEELAVKKLHPLHLKTIVKKCADKLAVDMCYPVDLRNYFSKDFDFTTEDATSLWSKLRKVISDFNGDAERFYCQYFGLLTDNLLSSKFKDGFISNTLLQEVANEILSHLSGTNVHPTEEIEPIASGIICEVELKSLQYLAGFVIHKLYNRFRFSRNSNSVFHTQYCLILQSCKLEADSSHTN